MPFRVDVNKAQLNNDNLKEEGRYEVVIKSIDERVTPNGKQNLSFTLVIRNDVEQRYQNGYIWHSVWKMPNPTEDDKLVNGYSFNQLMAFAKATKLPLDKDYKDVLDVCNDLVNKPVLITLNHDTYKGRTKEKVTEVVETLHPDCRHVYKEKTIVADTYAAAPAANFAAPPKSAADLTEVSDDDNYPF